MIQPKRARPYRWLLFDADGTLFDYEQAEQVALTKAFGQIGVPFNAVHLTTYRRFNQEVWQAFERGHITPGDLKVRRFELLFEEMGVDFAPAAFSALYLAALADCSELVDGAHELLQALRRAYRVAVVTNGLRAVQRPRLERSAICDFVNELIISEEIGYAKPAKEFFDATFARLGQPPKHQVLIVGDNWTSDIQGGIQYGIDTCWFNPGRQPRPNGAITHEVASLHELMDLLVY